METSLKPGFAQIFSCYPKNPSCPKFGGGAPLAPPPSGPYAYVRDLTQIPNLIQKEKEKILFLSLTCL